MRISRKMRLLVVPALAAMAIVGGTATASFAGRDSGWSWDPYNMGWAHFVSNGDLAQVADEEKNGYPAVGKFSSPSESHTYWNKNGAGWTDTWYPNFPEGEQVKVVGCWASGDLIMDCGAPTYGVA